MNILLYSETVSTNKYLKNFNCLIKFCIIVIFFLFFNNNQEKEINLDNEFPSTYETNVNFSNYSSIIKPIVLYYPEFNDLNFNYNNLSCNNSYDYKININQNNFSNDNTNKIKNIKNQIKLAKSHGIYGFAIYFIFDFDNIYIREISIFLNNNEIEIPFLLMWENNNFYYLYNFLTKRNKEEKNIAPKIFEYFVNQIQEFMFNKLYIKINSKPILIISNPLLFDRNEILLLRKVFKSKGIDDIFIICPLENYFYLKETKSIDGVYDLPKYELRNNTNIKTPIYYYSGIIYKNIKLNNFESKPVLFRTSLVELNLNQKEDDLKYYSLDKFYILNKNIFESTKKNFNRTKGFIFLDSWNNYRSGNYIEPDKIFGYASLNTFSKALFNLSLNEINYNFLYLIKNCIIAIQVHIFYEDLTMEIINKTNNIPFKFDLFITTVSLNKKLYIELNIKQYSKAHRYEICVVENKGRDVLPFINQMKNNIKKYKYICHIHSKKTKKYPNTGNMWRQYLYNNLLGSEKIISEIIYDFEKNAFLGFIFPDTYYNTINGIKDFESIDFKYHKENIYYIKFIVKQMFRKIKIGKKLIFPSGDMFWAKIDAIHQIFEIKCWKMFPKENGQLNKTLMHAIERIWIYLVKLNGYYYKTIFKTF